MFKLLHSLDDALVYNNRKNWGALSFAGGNDGVEVSVKMPVSRLISTATVLAIMQAIWGVAVVLLYLR